MHHRHKLAALGGIVALTAVACLVVLWLRPATLSVSVRILSATDGLSLGRPNGIQVVVTNRGSMPLKPVYTVQWDTYPYIWDGPTALIGPHESRQVLLQTTNYDAMPPPAPAAATPTGEELVQSVPFVVRVNNAGEAQYWVSTPWAATLRQQSLANGDFRLWRVEDFSGHGQAPFGWDAVSTGQAPDLTRTLPLGTSGAAFEVNRVTRKDEPDWAEAAIFHRVSVASCPTLQASLGNWPDFETSDGSSPIMAGGLQLFSNHYPGRALWIVASTTNRRYVLSNGTAIWQTTPSAGGKMSVDVTDALAALGETSSPTVNVKLFLAVHKQAPGLHRMEVNSVSCAGG